jgi:hypothetical protein
MITQLDPPLPLHTSKGSGWAHFVIDYGQESHLFWVVFMDADGSSWVVPNPDVRMYFNWSLGRGKSDGRPGEAAPNQPAGPSPIPLRPAGSSG